MSPGIWHMAGCCCGWQDPYPGCPFVSADYVQLQFSVYGSAVVFTINFARVGGTDKFIPVSTACWTEDSGQEWTFSITEITGNCQCPAPGLHLFVDPDSYVELDKSTNQLTVFLKVEDCAMMPLPGGTCTTIAEEWTGTDDYAGTCTSGTLCPNVGSTFVLNRNFSSSVDYVVASSITSPPIPCTVTASGTRAASLTLKFYPAE